LLDVINSKLGRWLMLIPFILALAACFYFMGVTAEIDNTLLEEKYLEKVLEIDLIDSLVDSLIVIDDDWYTYDYIRLLLESIDLLDAQPYTFAALYNTDLVSLSHRTASYADLYDPFLNEEFKEAVLSNECGHFISEYTPIDAPTRDMYIYYRWVPTDTSLEGRLLTVVAISKYTVTNHAASWVGIGAIILISSVTILNAIMIAVIVKLGWVYSVRAGDKHRREERE